MLIRQVLEKSESDRIITLSVVKSPALLPDRPPPRGITREIENGWRIRLIGYDGDELSGQVQLLKYGFVPDKTKADTANAVLSWEYGAVGAYRRRMCGMWCMMGKCLLPYEGGEHGLFRASERTAFGIEVFQEFDLAKRKQRYIKVLSYLYLRCLTTPHGITHLFAQLRF